MAIMAAPRIGVTPGFGWPYAATDDFMTTYPSEVDEPRTLAIESELSATNADVTGLQSGKADIAYVDAYTSARGHARGVIATTALTVGSATMLNVGSSGNSLDVWFSGPSIGLERAGYWSVSCNVEVNVARPAGSARGFLQIMSSNTWYAYSVVARSTWGIGENMHSSAAVVHVAQGDSVRFEVFADWAGSAIDGRFAVKFLGADH